MPFITVSQGRGSDIPDGVYPVVLVAISDPKTVTAVTGERAGQDIDLIDWTFAIDGGEHDGKEIRVSSSTATSPRSKVYAFLTALLGGKAPNIDDGFEKDDLIGRMALATVRIDDRGWPKIENLGAMPASMLGAKVAAATGAPTNEPVPAGTTIREATTDELPF